MKLGVVGSRTFNDYNLLKKTLDKYDIDEIVSGGANGADQLAERYAEEKNIKTNIFLPDWKKYGRKAGPLRNKQIVENSDYIIAFWDGVSRGTLSSINLAKHMGKDLTIVKFN